MEKKAISNNVSDNEVFEFLQKYGCNTNSFLLTYGGCDWFKCDSPPGLVAYVRRGHTCVIAGDPLCAPEDTLAVLEAFSQYTGKRCRIMLTLVSGSLIAQLKEKGYGSIEIGKDPFFDLANWKPRGNRAKKTRSAVNLARRTGVTVSTYRPSEKRDLHLEQEMQNCTRAWLAGQRGFTIRFFSAVKPLEHAVEKRYFIARYEGCLVGFVTCSPIYARHGWFIEDMLRQPQAPYGTTELLITTALQSLREEGFRVATLGIAPFSDMKTDIEHPGRTRLLRTILIVLGPFYNFRGVTHFRKKFAPSWWETVYLAFWPDRITWGLALDAINTLFPDGFLGLIRAWLASWIPEPILQLKAIPRRAFLFLHLDLRIPLKRYLRFLDSLAIGIGLVVVIVAVCAIVQMVTRSNKSFTIINELHHRGIEFIPIITLFLIWRFLAMLARIWQTETTDQVKRDKVTK